MQSQVAAPFGRLLVAPATPARIVAHTTCARAEVGRSGDCAQRQAAPAAGSGPRSKQRRRRQRRLLAHSAVPAGGSGGGPEAAVVEYNDTWTDIAFIALCRIAYGNIAGWQSDRSWTEGAETFRGMVEVSRALMRGRTAQQQRDSVIQGFPEVPPWFRRVFPYSTWGAELNARITPAFFTWLVGPMQAASAEVDGGVLQRSAVKIERCRYLAESGCTAMCVNLCKAPTQTFFTEQLGMPLTMQPNFDDFSCEMIFGKHPPPLSEDPVASQPCLAACATALPQGTRCHKLE